MSSPLDLASPGELDAHNVLAWRWLHVLWPLAILFHLAGNGAHILTFDLIGAIQILMALIAAAMLIRPHPAVAGALAGVFVLVLWLKLPVVGNHEVILGLFSLAVLAAVISDGTRWPERVAPAGRWILLISYGFIAFSKLNRGFLDAVGSCAVLFADEFGEVVGLRPSDSSIVASVIIVSTMVIEAAIPVLLISSRLRRYGVALALGFHFLLALEPASHIWDFSATLLALFLLFAPPSFHHELGRRISVVDRRPVGERTLVLSLILGLQTVAMAGGLVFLPVWTVAYPLWLAVATATVFWYLRHLPQAAPEHPDGFFVFGSSLRPFLTGALSLVIGLALLNGVAPYLEVRTAAAFNMYSNLRVVDGGSNHLIVGGLRSGDSASYVTITSVADESALSFYSERELMVPVENLDRYLTRHPEEDPLIIDDGQSVSARSVGYGQPADEGAFGTLGAVLSHKLTARRAVQLGEQGRCLRAWGPIG